MLFIMLTRLIGKQVHPEKFSLEKLKEDVEQKVAQSCPDVKWIANYALVGPYDYLDIFSASTLEDAMKVASIVRSFGHACTEIWPALEWHQFKELITTLPDEQ